MRTHASFLILVNLPHRVVVYALTCTTADSCECSTRNMWVKFLERPSWELRMSSREYSPSGYLAVPISELSSPDTSVCACMRAFVCVCMRACVCACVYGRVGAEWSKGRSRKRAADVTRWKQMYHLQSAAESVWAQVHNTWQLRFWIGTLMIGVHSQRQFSRGTPLTRQMRETPGKFAVQLQSTMSSNSSVSISQDPTISAEVEQECTADKKLKEQGNSWGHSCKCFKVKSWKIFSRSDVKSSSDEYDPFDLGKTCKHIVIKISMKVAELILSTILVK